MKPTFYELGEHENLNGNTIFKKNRTQTTNLAHTWGMGNSEDLNKKSLTGPIQKVMMT